MITSIDFPAFIVLYLYQPATGHGDDAVEEVLVQKTPGQGLGVAMQLVPGNGIGVLVSVFSCGRVLFGRFDINAQGGRCGGPPAAPGRKGQGRDGQDIGQHEQNGRRHRRPHGLKTQLKGHDAAEKIGPDDGPLRPPEGENNQSREIGRASCRERV